MNTIELFKYEILETCQRLDCNAHLTFVHVNQVKEETIRNFDTLKAMDKRFNDKDSFIAYFWCISTLYFLFYALNLQKNEFTDEISYLSEKIKKSILKFPDFNIKIEKDWADWQFNNNGLSKEFPPEKTTWCSNRLKAFKSFVVTGKCCDEYLPFLLFVLIEKTRIINHITQKEQSITWLGNYCAYINNEEEFFMNIDNFIINYFYFYCSLKRSEEKELFLFSNKYLWASESNRTHCNYENILPTAFDLDTMCSALNFDVIFRNKSKDIVYLVFRCFGISYRENSKIPDFFKSAQSLGFEKLSKHPGLVFCMYWSIRYMNYYDFKKLFLEENKSDSTLKDFDKETFSRLLFTSENTFLADSGISILQLIFYFLLFEFSAKVPYPLNTGNSVDKKEALRSLVDSISKKNWYKSENQLEHFKKIAKSCGLLTIPFTVDFSLLNKTPVNQKIGLNKTETVLNLIYNMIHFLQTENTVFLITELNFIREQQLKNYPVFISKKERKVSDSQIKTYEEYQNILHNIVDSGFIIKKFSQKIHPSINLIMQRNITCKLFDETDNFFKNNRTGIADYRTHYKNFFTNKYLYKERNMQTHYTDYQPIELLLDKRNCDDLLYCLYDAEKCFDTNMNISKYISFIELDRVDPGEAVTEKCKYFRKEIENIIICQLDKKDSTNVKLHPNGSLFDENGALYISKDDLKKIDYQKKISEQFIFDLKEFLGILFCIQNLCRNYNGSYFFDQNFLDTYGIQTAVYLIKTTLELQIPANILEEKI